MIRLRIDSNDNNYNQLKMYEITDSKKGLQIESRQLTFRLKLRTMYNALNEHGLNCFVDLSN